MSKNIQDKISRIHTSFKRNPAITRRSIILAETVKRSRLYEIGYVQRDSEAIADWKEYVYDNSFARPRRKKSK